MDSRSPPPDPFDDWHVWISRRFDKGAFTRWAMVTQKEARRRPQNAAGAYASVQRYAERHTVGSSRGRLHASRFWLEFDGPDLLHSCQGAYLALLHSEHTLGAFPSEDAFTLRYSGNRWLALDAALSVAFGSRFLGGVAAPSSAHGNVVILDGEGGEQRAVRRFCALWRGRGLCVPLRPPRLRDSNATSRMGHFSEQGYKIKRGRVHVP